MKKKIVMSILVAAFILNFIACSSKNENPKFEHEVVKEGIITGQTANEIASALGTSVSASENVNVFLFNSESDAKAAVKEHNDENTYVYGNVLMTISQDEDKSNIDKFNSAMSDILVTDDTIKNIIATNLGCNVSDIEFNKLELDTAVVKKYWYVEGVYNGENISYQLEPNGEIYASSQIAKQKQQDATASLPSEQSVQDFNNSIDELIQGDFNGLLLKVEYDDDYSDYTITISNDIQTLPDNDKQTTLNAIANEVQTRAYGYGLSNSSPMVYVYYQNGTKCAESKWANPREMDIKN